MGSLTTECLCGKTSLEVSGKPRFQALCHCTICQKLSGSDYAHNSAYARDQVKVVKGQNSFLKYKSSDPLTRHMCDTCGYHMYGELSGDTPIIAVPMGTVKRSTDANQPQFQPECHIFYDTRMNDVHDGLPKWAGFMEHSERLG